MTDYKTEAGKQRAYLAKEESFKRNTRYFVSEREHSISKNLESDAVIQKYSEYTRTFAAPIQAIEPSTFAFFGKAEQYYEDSIYSVINYYPFDGTHEEVLDWFVGVSNLDTSLLQQEWPTSVGHLDFDESAYVSFYAGPKSISQEPYRGKVKNQESALRLDPDKGTTVEFWMKKDSTENIETIFEIGTHPSVATTTTDEERVRFKLNTTAEVNNEEQRTSFQFTYISASEDGGVVSQVGVQDMAIGDSAGQVVEESGVLNAVEFKNHDQSLVTWRDSGDSLSFNHEIDFLRRTVDVDFCFSLWINMTDPAENRAQGIFSKGQRPTHKLNQAGAHEYSLTWSNIDRDAEYGNGNWFEGNADQGLVFDMSQTTTNNSNGVVLIRFTAPIVNGDKILDNHAGQWVHLAIVHKKTTQDTFRTRNSEARVQFYKNGVPWGPEVAPSLFRNASVPNNGTNDWMGTKDTNQSFILGDDVWSTLTKRLNADGTLDDLWGSSRFVGMMRDFLFIKHNPAKDSLTAEVPLHPNNNLERFLTDADISEIYNGGTPLADYTQLSSLSAENKIELKAYFRLNDLEFQDSSPSELETRFVGGALVLRESDSGISRLQVSSRNDTDWHHYALKVWQTETEGAETYTLNTKFYVDGVLQTTNSQDIGATKINLADNAMSGRIGLALDAATPAAGNPLSSQIDSFRFWKGKRSSREIGRYFDQKVYASDHAELEYDSRLGVNYRFNESPTGEASKDKIIIDYSGNDVIATINNYSDSVRVSTSAIDASTVSVNTEIQDPILYEEHTKVKELKDRLKSIGQSYDIENHGLLQKKLPGWLFSEMYNIQDTTEIDTLLHMMASVFDSTMVNLGSLRKLTRPEYSNSRSSFVSEGSQGQFSSTLESLGNSGKGEVFNTFVYENKIDFMERLLENFGFSRSEYKFLWDLKTEEMVESITENIRLERSASEIRRVLYDCLANAAVYALNRKGAESSYNAILNAIGLGRDVISFNVLGQNAEIRLDKQTSDNVVKKLKSISFKDNPEASLHQTEEMADEKSYLPADTGEVEYTFEGNFIFPKENQDSYSVIDSSIFGLYEISEASNPPFVFEFSDPNAASFQVSVVKSNSLSHDAKFVLSSRDSIIATQETSFIRGVYDNSVWNLSIKIYKDTEIGNAENSTLSEYKLDFTGYNYIGAELRREFKKTVSLTQQQYEGFRDANKTIFIGADKDNILDSVQKKTDIKVLGFNAWSTALTDDELKKRASHLTAYGLESPFMYPNVYDRDVITNPEYLSSLILKLQLSDYTSTKLEESRRIGDETSGNSELREFFGDLRGYSYPFIPNGFEDDVGKAVTIEHLSSVQETPIINVHGLDAIDVKQDSSDIYAIDSKPELKIISFEKSMYRAISNEMVDFISGISSFNNLIGEPVNKYRKNYKFLNYLKRLFFVGVQNDNQFERYISYYRWLDKSIGHFLSFLIPGSSPANVGIENVVESHTLERNKIEYKLPKLEYKEVDIEANAAGVEALDNERQASAAEVPGADASLPVEERPEEQSSSRSAMTAPAFRTNRPRTTSTNYRKFMAEQAYRPYKVSAEQIQNLSLGLNGHLNHIQNYMRSVEQDGEIVIEASNIKTTKKDYKYDSEKSKEKYEVWFTSNSDNEYLSGKADLFLPISFFRSEDGTDLSELKSELVISNNTNTHMAVQGMFGTKVNTTQPHRNVKIGTPKEDRPEAYNLTVSGSKLKITQPTGLASIFYKNSEREIFYNISNIKTDTENGNYTSDREIITLSNRSSNNRYFVQTEGEGLEKQFAQSVQTPQLVEYTKPDRKKQEHIIVSTFNGSSPESYSAYAKDQYAGEYSVYNSLNYRNQLLRDALNEWSSTKSEQFGLKLGETEVGSWHKINRNPKYVQGESSLEVKHDNLFVQNHIPQSDFGYSWITKSADTTIGEFLSSNMNMPHQHNFELQNGKGSESLIEFVSSSAQPSLDFVGLNTYNEKAFDDNYTEITNATSSLNSVLLNLNGPYGWPSWKQIRNEQNVLVRKQKQNNLYSVVFRGSSPSAKKYPGTVFDYKNTKENKSIHNLDRKVRTYKEVPVTKRFSPISFSIQPVSDLEFTNVLSYQEKGYSSQEISSVLWSIDWKPAEADLYELGMSKVVMRIDAAGSVSSYANPKFVEEVGMFEKPFLESEEVGKLNTFVNYSLNSDMSYGSTPQMNYVEKIYPQEQNTYVKATRERTKFDFFGWNSNRDNRSIILSGNLDYGNYQFESINLAPVITARSNEDSFKTSYFNKYEFVDLNNFDSSADISLSTHLSQSTWVLDSRKDFSSYPVDISNSYFNNTESFTSERDQGTRGEGILQNDYSLFPLGINSAFGAPPIAPVYNRRVVQNHGTSSYLAGESVWQAAEDHSVGPFYNDYENYSTEIKILGKEYSLTPEFTISRHSKELLLSTDTENTITQMSDFLYLTGTVNDKSSDVLGTSTKFFESYSNTDFLKYFLDVQENNSSNNFNLDPATVTLRTKSLKKILPYRGFYPAERVVQLSETFDEVYLPSDSYTATLFKETDFASSQEEAENLIKLRVQNSKAQAIRPLMAPGVLMNSIKAGVAVDYPIFSSSVQSAIDEIIDNTSDSELSMFDDYSLLPTGSDLCFTGSLLNSTQDTGIPRIKGNVSNRISFTDLMQPERLYGEVLYDNEPHPSASLLYGSKYHVALMERPALFGNLDKEKTKLHTGVDFVSNQIDFAKQLSPFKSAVQNFAAETVNFFLEDGNLTTLMSAPAAPELVKDKQYKMFIHLDNTGITMYDRHSAFGPAVDDGAVSLQVFDFETTTESGTQATGSISFRSAMVSALESGGSATGGEEIRITDHNNTTINYIFYSGSSNSTGDVISTDPYTVAVEMTDVGSEADLLVQAMNADSHRDTIEKTITTGSEGSLFVTNYYNVLLTQAASGVSGNQDMQGTTAIDSYILGFAGATGDTSSQSSFLVQTTSSNPDSHGHLPYVPPYLDPNTSPYAEITFTPSETDRYSIPQIIEGSTIEYHNLPSISENNGTNYVNSMNIGASLELKSYVALKRDNYSYTPQGAGVIKEEKNTQQTLYRWVIHPKWETPVLDFSNVSAKSLNLDSGQVVEVQNSPWKTRYQDKYYDFVSASSVNYLTTSVGMWHQKGEVLSHESPTGYVLGVSGPYVKTRADQVQSLAEAVGFVPKGSSSSLKSANITYGNKKLGKLAKHKDLCEAVVAIPYYEDKAGNMQMFEIKGSVLDRATALNANKEQAYFISYISSKEIDRKNALQAYREWYDDPGLSTVSTCAYHLRMLDKYVLPPQFDFIRNSKVKPHVQYMFQFKSTIKEEDLANLWQNLYPQSANGPGTVQHSRISQNKSDLAENKSQLSLDKEFHTTSIRVGDRGMYKNPEIFNNEEVRWLVFKCKYRAVKDYSDIIRNSITPFAKDIMFLSTEYSKSTAESFKDYGFNWPYDYFSLSELTSVSAKVDFESPAADVTFSQSDDQEVQILTSLTEQQEETTVQSSAEVSNTNNVINKNFVNVESSGGSSSMTFRKTLKQESDPAPTPANQMTIDTPDGHSIKSASESIYVNGVLQMQGSANDYTLSNGVITFNYDIDSTDGVIVTYTLVENS